MVDALARTVERGDVYVILMLFYSQSFLEFSLDISDDRTGNRMTRKERKNVKD